MATSLIGSRSLQSIFTNVFGSSVPKFNAVLEPVCKYNPDGTPVDPQGCIELVQRKNAVTNWGDTAAAIVGAIAGSIPVIGTASSLALKTANTIQTLDRAPLTFNRPAQLTPGGTTMAFQDGDSGFFGDIWGGINNVLQSNGQNLLNLGFNAANSFVQSQFAQPVGNFGAPAPMAQPVMAAVPAIVGGAGRAVATVGRGFFNRFPSLATSMQSLRNRGANVTRSSLYSAMRRFGPEMLVSGGILTAAAVSELAVAGPGRRRMNPGNVHALRRAHRRMKSFHRVCVDNDQLMKRRRK